MAPAQKAKHDITHMPPYPGCATCRSTRTPTTAHSQQQEHLRVTPLRVGDDCFLRNLAENEFATCLVMRLYPYGINMAIVVPRKGAHPCVVVRIARFVKELGLVHFAYRCDREISLNTTIEEASAKTGRVGKMLTLTIHMPSHCLWLSLTTTSRQPPQYSIMLPMRHARQWLCQS